MPFMISIYLLPDCLSLCVFTLDCRATRDTERGGESREDADGNLQDGFPSFFLHRHFLSFKRVNNCRV